MTQRLFKPTLFGLLACFPWAAQAFAAPTANYFQNGVAYEVLIDEEHVLIIGDGSVSLTDQAIGLASAGLTTSLVPFGDSDRAAVVRVTGLATQIAGQLQAQPGVTAVRRVFRFRAGGEPVGITDQVVVELSGVSPTQLEAQYGLKLNAKATANLGLPGVSVFKVLDGDALQVAEALRGDPRVANQFAHADLIVPTTTYQVTPADDLFDQQWHLENTGQFGSGITLADIEVLEAWKTTLGDGIRIGMIDDGVDIDHDDLIPNYLGFSQSLLGDDDADNIGNLGFHGTAVMGLMAATANSIGVRGVAPEARWTASNGISGGATVADLASGFDFAMDTDVDVHNNSWGFRLVVMVPEVLSKAIERAANTGRDGKGVVICFAAGNEGAERKAGEGVAMLPQVIQVGATGYRDTLVSYSNFGETQDVTGPTLGDDNIGLVTTDIAGGFGFNDGNSFFDFQGQPDYTKQMGGTSGASPVVSGVAALVLAVNPDLNRHQVREVLTHTAEKVSPDDANYDESTGFSPRYGYGRVNAKEAVTAAQASRTGNVTWPGVPQDIEIRIDEGEDDLVATISWEPSGMPPAEEDGEVDSDEVGVIIAYLVPGQEGPDDLQWAPDDGESHDACNPNMFDECTLYDPFRSPNMVIIFSGSDDTLEDITRPDGSKAKRINDLPIAGSDPGSAQTFAIYAFNNQQRYSFGFVFDQNGDAINVGGEEGGIIVPPPDGGRPIDPGDIPDEDVGKNDPPSVTATADRTLCSSPCTVEFHGGAVTPNGIVDRGWSFGDGSTSAQDSAMHTYGLSGTYNAVYFAMDDNQPSGRISTKLIQIDVTTGSDGGVAQPGPISARLTVQTPAPYTAPDALVRFTVETTGIGQSSSSARVTYNWDFGDGNTGTGQTTENMYANPGYYSVVVQVTEEFTNGQTSQVSASTIVHIEGTREDDGQSEPTTDDSGTAGTSGCGILGLGMALLTFLGLVALRRRF